MEVYVRVITHLCNYLTMTQSARVSAIDVSDEFIDHRRQSRISEIGNFFQSPALLVGFGVLYLVGFHR